LSRLASKIADIDTFQVEIKKTYGMNEFREDEKTLMRKVGIKGDMTSFVVTDNSIKQESFLEDINNILNTGEVPNIFSVEEKAEVMEGLRPVAKDEERCPGGTPQEFFAFFIERCKKNLHLCICFSPIGDSFRNRVRNFPSLVNCTTIDWFSEWPPDALESVAETFLKEIEMDYDVRESCVQMVQTFHTSTQAQAKRFLKEKKRNYYITPTSYLEMIKAFQLLLAEKRREVWSLKEKYANGHETIIATEGKVGTMKQELLDLQPILEEKSKEVNENSAIVGEKKAAADIVAEQVSKDRAFAQGEADVANGIKQDCDNELAKALPALEKAKKALDAIDKKDIAEMKGV
jgi:dynein heavy chain, axonemal